MSAQRGTVVITSSGGERVYGAAVINKASGLMITMYDVRDAVRSLLSSVFKDCTDFEFAWGTQTVSFLTGGAAPYTSTVNYTFTENIVDFAC